MAGRLKPAISELVSLGMRTMDKVKNMNYWQPMTNLVRIGLNNKDGLCWNIEVQRYVDETREGLRGMPIGYIDAGGFHSNEDDKDRIYKMVFTSDGYVMFFEKNRHIDALEKRVAVHRGLG